MPAAPRVVPVGRLDFDSEGLILLTNDGSLCKLLTCPQFRIPKTYAVLVQSKGPVQASAPPSDDQLALLSQQGVRLQNGVVLQCKQARLLRSARVPLSHALAAGVGGGGAGSINKRKKRKENQKQCGASGKRVREGVSAVVTDRGDGEMARTCRRASCRGARRACPTTQRVA